PSHVSSLSLHDALPICGAHAGHDRVERLVPRRASPAAAACRAEHRVKQPPRIVEDLWRGLASHAEEAAAVGIVDVAGHARHAARSEEHTSELQSLTNLV